MQPPRICRSVPQPCRFIRPHWSCYCFFRACRFARQPQFDLLRAVPPLFCQGGMLPCAATFLSLRVTMRSNMVAVPLPMAGRWQRPNRTLARCLFTGELQCCRGEHLSQPVTSSLSSSADGVRGKRRGPRSSLWSKPTEPPDMIRGEPRTAGP